MAKKPPKKVRRRTRKSNSRHAGRAKNRADQLENGNKAWTRFFGAGPGPGPVRTQAQTPDDDKD